MSNAALDILKARQTAIRNDVAVKQVEYQDLYDKSNSLLDNVNILETALVDIQSAIELLQKENLDESYTRRTTSKSKKATP